MVDSRNRRVPGLYIRNGRFYGQLWADRGDGRKTARKFPLMLPDGVTPARRLSDAKEAFDRLRNDRREDRLPTEGRKPSFGDFADTYLASGAFALKKLGTRKNEQQSLARWKVHMETSRVDKITAAMVARFVDKRLKGEPIGERRTGKASARTVNLDLTVLRNVLHAARKAGHLRELPRIEKLAESPPRARGLITPAAFEALVKAARVACERNGEQLADYLGFLAYSGAREKEALRVRWADVDFSARTVTIGADGDTKNRMARTVDLTPALRSLLKRMHAERAPDTEWLFPSPMRGDVDRPAKSFRESLRIARSAARLPAVGFHHLRVYFASHCVMSGIDFMTTAAWLGHKDGGILVGKVYGKLLDEHRRKMAARVSFGKK